MEWTASRSSGERVRKDGTILTFIRGRPPDRLVNSRQTSRRFGSGMRALTPPEPYAARAASSFISGILRPDPQWLQRLESVRRGSRQLLAWSVDLCARVQTGEPPDMGSHRNRGAWPGVLQDA